MATDDCTPAALRLAWNPRHAGAMGAAVLAFATWYAEKHNLAPAAATELLTAALRFERELVDGD